MIALTGYKDVLKRLIGICNKTKIKNNIFIKQQRDYLRSSLINTYIQDGRPQCGGQVL